MMIPSILCDKCNKLFPQNLIVEREDNFYCRNCFEQFIENNELARKDDYSFSVKYPKTYRVIKILFKKEFKVILHVLYVFSLALLVYLVNQNIFNDNQLIISLIVLNLPYIFFVWSVVFTDLDDFTDSIWYTFRWDIISLIKGEPQKDWNAERGLKIWIYASVIIVITEYMLINILKWQF
ncbi:MAG: hypothetical protein IPM56_16515 [Ignavibacteriales bacterium]|nr:MAG: hypothetical protein IPM56_16515 [Ignavibacteriales bacterium]